MTLFERLSIPFPLELQGNGFVWNFLKIVVCGSCIAQVLLQWLRVRHLWLILGHCTAPVRPHKAAPQNLSKILQINMEPSLYLILQHSKTTPRINKWQHGHEKIDNHKTHLRKNLKGH